MSTVEIAPEPPNISGGEDEDSQLPEPEAVPDTTEPEPEPEPKVETPPAQRPIKKAQRTKKVNIVETQKKPKSALKPPPPVTDDSDEGAEDEESDDTAKIVTQSLMLVVERVLRLFLYCIKIVCRILCGTFSLLRHGSGLLFGGGLFAGVAYVIATYIMSPVSEKDVPNFEARLKFLLRCQVWSMLPVFLAALVGMIRRDSKVHASFAREVFENALLTLFNLLLLATHLDIESLVWVDACAVTSAVFSILHWLCLIYTKRSGSVFSLPGTLLNFVVMAYNIYVIFGQDIGYIAVKNQSEMAELNVERQGRPTYWDQITMCHMVDRMFCQP